MIYLAIFVSLIESMHQPWMYIPFIFKAEIICINHLLPLRDTFKFLFVAVTQFRRLRMQSGITYQTYLVCGVQTFTIFLTKLLKKKDVYL